MQVLNTSNHVRHVHFKTDNGPFLRSDDDADAQHQIADTISDYLTSESKNHFQ